jgi:LPS O-antigen subunit length determinant protein (WzzB/FepE family)
MENDKLQENIDTLQTELSTLTAIEINQIPFSSIKPDSPRKIKIVALAAVFGVFIAVFAAFLIEFWTRNKDRIRIAA